MEFNVQKMNIYFALCQVHVEQISNSISDISIKAYCSSSSQPHLNSSNSPETGNLGSQRVGY